ncbi:hypothetical protein M2157_001997 [Streptomyces sp. SAI-127]|nr:hypothetical protein [Streptomyces sp. SAI-127]
MWKSASRGPRHLLGQELTHGTAGDPAQDLTDEEPLGERVVSGRGARLPEQRLGGEPCGGGRPVVELLDRALPVGQSRGVRQQVPYQHLLLAGGGELRPVPGDRGVHVELAAVGEDQGAQCRHRLGRGEDVGDRVPLPRCRPVGVGVAGPDVHHRFTAHEDGHGSSDIPLLQQRCQLVGDGGEQIVVCALDVGHAVY